MVGRWGEFGGGRRGARVWGGGIGGGDGWGGAKSKD